MHIDTIDHDRCSSAAAVSGSLSIPDDTDTCSTVTLDDPALWPKEISSDLKKVLVEKGPVRVQGISYPSRNGRRFTEFHYVRKLPNGESLDRTWLVYSVSQDCLFCFCCKIFSHNYSNSFVETGYCDWHHTSKRLGEHELSKDHVRSMLNWIDMQKALASCATIDNASERLMQSEIQYWRNVFERLIAIIKFLTQHNLALRGSVEKLYMPSNGNFLGLVELLGEFDPVIKEHIRRVLSHEVHDHYLGKHVQNELISLMGEKVRDRIIGLAKSAKYYSVLLDCTPDKSHQEQLSLTLRFVVVDETVSVEEHFLYYIAITETTGEAMATILIDQLQSMGLCIEDMRGQGYDNGANMVGRHSGVQARIINMNSRAFFTPCCAHSLNLLLGDMAKSCTLALSFFGIIQRIYVLFSASTQRWDILKKCVKKLTVKPLSETRWECRVDSVKAIRYQATEIFDALLEVADNTSDSMAHSQALSLANELKEMKFVVSIVFWYEILNRVNVISKLLQSETCDLSDAIAMMQNVLAWLQTYRNNGFESAVAQAKVIVEDLGGEPVFKDTRVRRRKKSFDYEHIDEPIINPQQSFKINCFNTVIDTAIVELRERFKRLDDYNQNFGFLVQFKELPKDKLIEKCKLLESVLTSGESRDIDAIMLADELEVLSTTLPSSVVVKPKEILTFIHKNSLMSVYPNAVIAFRIFLTIPVTVASSERSFSKLKLIKTYLRSTMTQERLTNLALLSIENDITKTIDYNEVIDQFAKLKSRKVKL